MDIQNRMDDVVRLRCHACQDFLKLIIKPGWQIKLWEEEGLKYAAVHEDMRNHGIDSYSVDDMDVTLIYEILSKRKIASAKSPTFFALQQLKDDRNITQHSSCNEDVGELYLRALLALCNIRAFVITVDREELSIEDSVRLEYRRKYIAEIEKLMDVIDEERIALVQRGKDIDRDIRKILQSPDPHRAWFETYESYEKRSKIDGNKDQITEFNYRCSDAGIPFAHKFAVYSAGLKKDWVEYNRRLIMMYKNIIKAQPISPMDINDILDCIDLYLYNTGDGSDEIDTIIDDLHLRGYDLKKNQHGFYRLKLKPKKK